MPPMAHLTHCSWCRKKLARYDEVYRTLARLHDDMNIDGAPGEPVQIYLFAARRRVETLWTAPYSPERAEGYDFLFQSCSRECDNELLRILLDEGMSPKALD